MAPMVAVLQPGYERTTLPYVMMVRASLSPSPGRSGVWLVGSALRLSPEFDMHDALASQVTVRGLGQALFSTSTSLFPLFLSSTASLLHTLEYVWLAEKKRRRIRMVVRVVVNMLGFGVALSVAKMSP